MRWWPFRSRYRDRPMGEANPFEAYLLTACLLTGIAVLSGATSSRAVDAALQQTGLRWVWASLLLFGGGSALLGLYWPGDLFTGVEIKRVGLFAAGVGTLAYSVAAALFGWEGAIVAASNGLFSFACFTRIFQVTRRIRAARTHLRNVRRFRLAFWHDDEDEGTPQVAEDGGRADGGHG